MPDDGENFHDLNPNAVAAAISDLNGDGYADLEDFISGLDSRVEKVDWASVKNSPAL